jgi:hypothetical protein
MDIARPIPAEWRALRQAVMHTFSIDINNNDNEWYIMKFLLKILMY